MNKIITIYLIAMTISSMQSCKSIQKESKMPPVNVKVATVDKELSSNSIWFASSTEPQYSVTIEPRVNGYLKSVEYRSGAPVKEGETIFEIEPSLIYTTYYSALASLESAKASLVEAESNYKRAIPLAVIDAISRTSLDQYRTTFAAAKANVKSAEEALKNASLNLSYTSIKAPMSGLIADSPAVAGDYVGPGTKFTTLTTISYCDTLKLPLAIPTARYLKYIDNSNSYDNKNLLSDITIILADSSEYNHKATYDYTQKEITSGNSTVVIYAKVANPSNLLKPNMFTRVRANIGNETEKIIIPQEAVTQMQGVSSVWVIKGDSTAIFRVVTVGSKYGSGWHITSGLDAGEKVATSSQLKLHEGAKVNPIY